MYSNGEIQRGMEPQKKYPIEEREYIYCRGRINNTICAGLTSEGYENDYNARRFGQGRNNVPLPTASSGEGKIDLNASVDFAYMIGTGSPVNITKRFLVVEAKASNIPSGETNKTLHVKLSNSKDIGDDGGLYAFTLTTDYQKFYIDLTMDSVSGRKYVAIINGLISATTMSVEIKRIYFTDEKEANVFVAYDGDASELIWQGWTGPQGTNMPGIIETNDIYLEGSGTTPTQVKTVKLVDVSNKNFIGIKYNVIEKGANTESIFAGIYDGNVEKGSGFIDISTTGEKIGYIRVTGDPINGSGNILSENNPISGHFAISLMGTKDLKVKITKVWLL